MLLTTSCQKEDNTAQSGDGIENLSRRPQQALDAPTLAATSSTQTSITLMVCAGASGALAGFSVQWMSRTDFDLTGWPANPDIDPAVCKAGFSGNAHLSRYNLLANECVTINIGDLLFDEGASSNCITELSCSTDYVFRAFAHATSTRSKSNFSTAVFASTLGCANSGGGCTYTQGYWATHYDNDVVYNIPWPVTTLTLGTISYNQAQLLSILNTTPGTNGLIALAHELIAAKLNIANGADPTAIAATVAAADALIGSLVVPPVGTDFLSPSVTNELYLTLNNYNTGATGPGHCQ